MKDFVAGCIGGMLGTLLSFPIDTVRIRLQSGVKTNKNPYSGILSPTIGIGAEKAIVFGVYNQTYKHTKNDFKYLDLMRVYLLVLLLHQRKI